jgi:hypothetical protein
MGIFQLKIPVASRDALDFEFKRRTRQRAGMPAQCQTRLFVWCESKSLLNCHGITEHRANQRGLNVTGAGPQKEYEQCH